jgi:GT2 family glycosyltransferase
MSLQAFGERAARVAQHAGGEIAVIACEPAFAAAALSAALTLRRAGTHFHATIVWEDERTRLIREGSRRFCNGYETWDEVRLLLNDAVAALDPRALHRPSDDDRAMLHEFVRLADALIVRSIAERERIEAALGPLPRETDVVVGATPAPHAGAPAEPTDIVIFAPHERGDALAPYLTAAIDVPLPVTVVARDAARLPSAVRFVPPGEAGAALARARVIVDASGDGDPGVARMLTSFGRPLAVSSTGGAPELLLDVVAFQPWDRASILAAIGDAFAAPAPRLRAQQPPAAPVARPPIDRTGAKTPLVSVIVTTYNRPLILGDTLAAIERQRYPALEIIVVNDAGTDVAEVVARFPRARLIDQPENRGPAAGRNAGLRAANGTFAIFFDDDDEMFPDHVGALAGALERSGLDVAYGQMLNGFVTAGDDGHYRLERVLAHTALLDNLEIQWGGSLATTAVMFRRRVIDEIGFVDETLVANEDYEFWIRLAAGRACARVSAVTSLYFVRTDGSNRSNQNARERYLAAHRAIFAKHPSPRPLVNAGRTAMLRMFGGDAG